MFRRFGDFWRRQGRLSKIALVIVLVIAATVLVGLALDQPFTSPGADDEPVTAGVAPEATSSGDPIRCLDAAGLSEVEEQDVDLWRGLHDGPVYAIVVHKLATPAKAPVVVAGTYAVTGRFKVAAEGIGLTSQEGLEADALVQEVADCLGD